jgi:hypothetical protein
VTTPMRTAFPGGQERHKTAVAPPGEGVLLSAAVAMGILLMGMQLWILTVALEQFERHHYREVYALTGFSALIFAGGVAILWMLRRTPRVRSTYSPTVSVPLTDGDRPEKLI